MTPKEVIAHCRKSGVKVYGKVVLNSDVCLNMELVKSDVIWQMQHQGMDMNEDCVTAEIWKTDGNLYIG